jgi:hypothetical protein
VDNFAVLIVAQKPTPMTCRDSEPVGQHLSGQVNYLRITEYLVIETTKSFSFPYRSSVCG